MVSVRVGVWDSLMVMVRVRQFLESGVSFLPDVTSNYIALVRMTNRAYARMTIQDF